MTQFFPGTAAISGFLFTYLFHSAFLALLAGMVMRFRWASKPDLRVLIWKTALIVPVVTSLSISLFDLPHFGMQLIIFDIAPKEAFEPGVGDFPVVLPEIVESSLSEGVAQTAQATPHSQDGGVLHRFVSAISTLGVAARQFASHPITWLVVTLGWIFGTLVGCARLTLQAIQLNKLRNRGTLETDPFVIGAAKSLAKRAGLREHVELLQSPDSAGPLAGGILRPFILIPKPFVNGLDRHELKALLAHELAHIARRDPLWNLIGNLIFRVLFVQPLNRVIVRQLQIEMEFVADQQAGVMLNERSDLAGCLTRLADWLDASRRPLAAPQPLAANMAAFHSILGRRVEMLLAPDAESKPSSRRVRSVALALVSVACIAAIGFAPRAVAYSSVSTDSAEPAQSKVTDAGEQQGAPQQQANAKVTPDDLPEEIKGLDAVIVGRLVTKDVEKGSLLITVDAIHSVGLPRNNTAKDPKSAIGKTLAVDGYSGEYLDRLLLIKPGETVRTYVMHTGGNRLKFHGEDLTKVEPVTPEDYPELPEEFRGFQGVVVGTIVKKKSDANELTIRVEKIEKTGEKSQAKNSSSIVGKPLRLSGFYTLKDAFREVTIGETIKCGVEHQRKSSDDLTVVQFSSQVGDADAKKSTEVSAGSSGAKTTPDDLPEGIKGFQGGLVGRLAMKDVEKGSLLITVDAIAYTGFRNEAKDPKSAIGKTLLVDGLSGDVLDRLLLIKPGETLRTGIRHTGGKSLLFPGEDFWKVNPVQPGDYPDLPEESRGFEGLIVGKIVKKKADVFELIVQVDKVRETSDKSQAKNAASIVGKEVRLSGLRQHKDRFNQLTVGETIECGLEHKRKTSDDLTVVQISSQVGDGTRQQIAIQNQVEAKVTPDELPEGMHGFVGSMVGRLVTKDVEKGTFIVTIDAVPSGWLRNKAKNPKSAIGKTFEVDGLSGETLDKLLLIKPGETLRFGARHAGGNRLSFPGEDFWKVAPVQPGDYPDLPEEFRGFQGVVLGRIVKKIPDTFELIVRIDQVKETSDKSQAKNPASIVGKLVRLYGLGSNKDKFRGLEVGDAIECRLESYNATEVAALFKVTDILGQVGDSQPTEKSN